MFFKAFKLHVRSLFWTATNSPELEDINHTPTDEFAFFSQGLSRLYAKTLRTIFPLFFHVFLLIVMLF